MTEAGTASNRSAWPGTKAAVRRLRSADPVLGKLIDAVGPATWNSALPRTPSPLWRARSCTSS